MHVIALTHIGLIKTFACTLCLLKLVIVTIMGFDHTSKNLQFQSYNKI